MRFIINFPNLEQNQVTRLSNTIKEFADMDDKIFQFLFMNVRKFQIIDLEKGIMYSWDGQHALVQPA